MESKESLVAVKVGPAKGRAYGQRLLTILRTRHKAWSSHGQEAGILTCKPEKENQNKMRTLRSVFFSNTEMYDKGGKSYLSTRFLVARNCRPLKSTVTQAGFHPKSV